MYTQLPTGTSRDSETGADWSGPSVAFGLGRNSKFHDFSRNLAVNGAEPRALEDSGLLTDRDFYWYLIIMNIQLLFGI